MTNVIYEKNNVPIVGEYDVIVVGGGIAGVAAAVAARRCGMKVLVLEKSILLGGLATLGLIAYYLPLCDGHGRKVMGGIAEELLKLSVKYGYGDIPEVWRSGSDPGKGAPRYEVKYSGHTFVLALDELIESEGIDVMFDTLFCRPVMEHGRCEAVIVENKSGRGAYRGKIVIDTSGDADVMALAGAEMVNGVNSLSIWYYATSLGHMGRAVENGRLQDGVDLTTHGHFFDANGSPQSDAVGQYRYSGIDAKQVNRMVKDSRRLLRSKSGYMGLDGNACVLTLPGMPQFRTTRRIRGTREMQPGDVFKNTATSIGCVCDWRKAGPVFEVPYESLTAPGIANIITAGRTVAANGDMWEVMRVIPAAALTGQAAGTAAAIAVEKGTVIADIQVSELQSRLADDGIIIHWNKE